MGSCDDDEVTVQPLKDDNTYHWAEPGIYTVAPGVYRIPLPLQNNALRAVNVYAITDGSKLVLVDSGWDLDESRAQLSTALGAIGAELGDISEFLITHVHADHYSQAVALRREYGGVVTLGANEARTLEVGGAPGAVPLHAQAELLIRCGARTVADEIYAFVGKEEGPDSHMWESPDQWLRPGTRQVLPGRQLDVLATPGHTAGHVVFLDDAAGLMFSGDHVLPHITPSIGFEAAPPELPLGDFLDSLRLVRERPDVQMLPAHGPVWESVHKRVDELLDHHAQRLEVTADALVRGGSDGHGGTAYEAAHGLEWTRRKHALADMDMFNRMLAIIETGAHLDLLASQGKLTVTETDGVRHYAPA